MNAIIETGGKQYKVAGGDVIYVEKLDAAEGDTVSIDKVLMVFDGEKVKMGSPYVPKVNVTAKVVKNGKNKKVVVFKMKPKKNYRRKQGHRQAYTKLQIETINV